jgi:hypothetical protein
MPIDRLIDLGPITRVQHINLVKCDPSSTLILNNEIKTTLFNFGSYFRCMQLIRVGTLSACWLSNTMWPGLPNTHGNFIGNTAAKIGLPTKFVNRLDPGRKVALKIISVFSAESICTINGA